jgi:hypothetical protein
VQEKTAIAALEPQLVVVNDNVCGSHHSHWRLRVDARSIQPLARHFAGNVVDAACILRSRAGPSLFCGETNASKAAIGCAKQLTP